MPNLSSRASGVPAVGELLVLTDELAGSRVELAPGRGAIVTSFSVRGRELLYLDTATLADPAKNVRGGIPVLFPSPGKLAGDAFTRDGRRGAMKQHGFARTLPWTPSATEAASASVTLTLASSDATRAQFPWDFVLALQLSLRGARLTIDVRLQNTDSLPLPFALGFHPYFAVSDKRRARIDTRATSAFDNVEKRVVPFSGFDLTQHELDLHLLDHGSTESTLQLADDARVVVRGSAEFTRWVVWTLAGKDFVCLEPWTGPQNALQTGEGLLYVPPGGAHEGRVEIELLDATRESSTA